MKTTSKTLSKSKSNTPVNAYLVSDSTKKKIEKLHYDILTNQLKGFEKAVELGAILSEIEVTARKIYSLDRREFQDNKNENCPVLHEVLS